MKYVRLGILGSGKGTNCRAILESIRSGVLAAEVRVVISDVFDAPILEIAREFGAGQTIEMGDNKKTLERIKIITEGTGCDCVVEAAGQQTVRVRSPLCGRISDSDTGKYDPVEGIVHFHANLEESRGM